MPPADNVPAAHGFVPKIPFLLRMIQAQRALGGGGADEDQQRKDVLDQLSTKSAKLSSACGLLEMKLAVETNPAICNQISNELSDARGEMAVCDARYAAIAADQPFNWPGAQAETDLLNAIAAVDQAVAVNAAIGALLAAVDQLVQAFKASST